MSETKFEKQGNTLIVKPEGKLDTATSPVLGKEITEHLDGIQNVVLDLKDVAYTSSGGIRMMLEIEQLLEDRGGKMTVCHVNDYILNVFDMVGFMNIVEVVRE